MMLKSFVASMVAYVAQSRGTNTGDSSENAWTFTSETPSFVSFERESFELNRWIDTRTDAEGLEILQENVEFEYRPTTDKATSSNRTYWLELCTPIDDSNGWDCL